MLPSSPKVPIRESMGNTKMLWKNICSCMMVGRVICNGFDKARNNIPRRLVKRDSTGPQQGLNRAPTGLKNNYAIFVVFLVFFMFFLFLFFLGLYYSEMAN